MRMPLLSKDTSKCLIFEHDGYTLKGALASTTKDGISVSTVIESRSLNPAHAIEEILTGLHNEHGNKLPKKAIFSTALITPSLLPLPVNPTAVRSPSQMKELIRWELEGAMAEYNALWKIGTVLMGRGYLSRQQRHDCLVDLALSKEKSSGNTLKRFGDIAIENGYIDSSQLNESLLLHEQLVMLDEDIFPAWQAQTSPSDEDVTNHPWLCSAIGLKQRQTWANAFQKNHVHITHIYPHILGHYNALLDTHNIQTPHVHLIASPEQLICIKATKHAIERLAIETRNEAELSAQHCIGLCNESLTPDITHLYVTGISKDVISDLSSQMDQTIIASDAPHGAMHGIAAHALGTIEPHSNVAIIAHDPAPPIWKNRDFYRFGSVALLLLTIVATEIYLQSKYRAYNHELKTLQKTFHDELELQREAQTINTEATGLEGDIEEKQAMLKQLDKELQTIENVLFYRQDVIPALLITLGNTISDDILIDRLEEITENSNHFTLSGWALTNTGAQLFFTKLDPALHRWKLRVDNPVIRQATGRTDLQGYAFSFDIVPLHIDNDAHNSQDGGNE